MPARYRGAHEGAVEKVNELVSPGSFRTSGEAFVYGLRKDGKEIYIHLRVGSYRVGGGEVCHVAFIHHEGWRTW